MAKYESPSVTKAKMLIASRLSFVLALKLKTTTRAILARRIQMSPQMLGRLARGVYHHVSLDAMLVAATRLNVKYKVSMEWGGTGPAIVEVELEDLYPGVHHELVDTILPKHSSIRHH